MNFAVVFKQTLKSTFSQISTSLLIALYCIIVAILLIMVPALVLNKGTSAEIFSRNYLGQMMYTIGIMLSIFCGVFATNANELAEMTFIISRPVSRKIFLIAKSLCVIGIALCLFVWTLIMYVIYDAIVKNFGYSPFSNDSFNWATAIVPTFLIITYSVYLPFFLRTFFKDKIITLFLVLTALASYQIYMIVANVAFHDINPLYAYLVIPTCVYGVGSILSVALAFGTIQKVAIKV